MAKKKGAKGKGASEAPKDASNVALEAESSAAHTEGAPSEAMSAAPSANLDSPSAKEAAPPSSDINGDASLAGELAALRDENAALKAKLAALSEENAKLKASAAAGGAAPALPAIDPTRTAQLEELQKRIASLKAEQAEADAAREAAWRQLKTAVADIARLAAPDAPKASTPTAGAAAVFASA